MRLLLAEIEKIEIDVKKIDQIELIYDMPFLLIVHWNKVKFEFFLRLKENSQTLYIFGNGAYNREKTSLPVFQRHSWVNDLDESIVIYNDPTLYLGEINLGWGQGNAERFYLMDLSVIINDLISKLQVSKENVIFYGSSAGGFLSLYLAGLIRGTKALVNNPQVFVSGYYPTHVKNMYKVSYPGLEEKVIEEKFKDRLDILAFFNSIQYVPPFIYIQNLSWSNDVNKQLLPFLNQLNEIKDYLKQSKIKFEFYHHPEQGHNPLGKEETIKYLKLFNS